MLVGQVVSGVELKYEYMVNSCLPPTVGVDAWNIKTNLLCPYFEQETSQATVVGKCVCVCVCVCVCT